MTQPNGPSHQIEMKEKQEIIQAEHKAATLHGRTDAEVNSVRGRYSATERSTIVGADPNITYKTAPTWSRDPSGPEPPLGVDISQAPIVGEWFEVQASIDALNDGPDELINQQGSARGVCARTEQLASSLPAPSSKFQKRKI